jgi:ABC-2 type transport system ATP-binding protein
VTDPVVVLDGVRRTFGTVTALDSLDLQVRPGEVTVLLGPNGAGKTTAVRMITGALPPESGAVRVFGLDTTVDGQRVRQRCGVVSAKPALYDRLTGEDNLRYAAQLWGLDGEVDTRLRAAAARFGIDYALGLRVGGYSTGMKTRLALARAILHDPDLLLLDEPTSGLDPESSHAVLGLIDEMAESGKTVVMCTHLLLEAEGLADQVVVMAGGRDVMSGSPDDLVRRYWPSPVVVVDAEDRSSVDAALSLGVGVAGVVSYEREGDAAARIAVDSLTRVPDLVASLVAAGARVTRVTPHEPSLEELYFRIRADVGITDW